MSFSKVVTRGSLCVAVGGTPQSGVGLPIKRSLRVQIKSNGVSSVFVSGDLKAAGPGLSRVRYIVIANSRDVQRCTGRQAIVNYGSTRVTHQQTNTYWVRIFMSGPIDVAKQVLRAECLREGLCVTVEPTTFIYTGGEELGYVVGLLNYPRFPTEQAALWARAESIANALVFATHQHSALLMDSNQTVWRSQRKEL